MLSSFAIRQIPQFGLKHVSHGHEKPAIVPEIDALAKGEGDILAKQREDTPN
jgi:hypothetical protein